jgi:dihydroorotate dehydrogenase electron transfer subunit
MHTGNGQVVELILEDGLQLVRLACPSNLIPSPGQYLLAGDGSDSPLPVPLFYTDSAPQGGNIAPPLSAAPAAWRHFIAVAQLSNSWDPGRELSLRGPLGRGFTLPASCRKIGLIAFEASPARLKGLIQPALERDAAVVLVCASAPEHLPDQVEIQPMSALEDVVEWADYVACDVSRENISPMRERLKKMDQIMLGNAGVAKSSQREHGRIDAQILIHTPVPCGGMAECGVCAVTLESGWKLACTDGPVFDWRDVE